jgi:hypothetical protein
MIGNAAAITGERQMNRKQSGMTLIGFIIVLGVAGVFAYCGMKVFPMYTEYFSVKQALDGMSKEAGLATESPAKIKDLFFRRLYVSYVESVEQKDVKVERTGDGYIIKVAYEVRRPLISNLDVVGNFKAEQNLRRGGGG